MICFCAHRVVCLSCGEMTEREPFQQHLAALNPAVARAVALMPQAGQAARTDPGLEAQVRGLDF